MANTDPISQLVHSTVRILCFDENGNQSSGTGYIYSFCEANGKSIPCVITNKHVVKGAVRGVFNLTLKDNEGLPDLGNHEAITVNDINRYCIPHPDLNVDLVAFPIATILNNSRKDGKNYHYVPLGMDLIASESLLNSLTPMEEIVMIGYPNGLWDALHNLPIIRNGITATHPKLRLNGKPEFLIDAACYPGSSGSPVFLVNLFGHMTPNGSFNLGSSRIALLGTLYAGPHATTEGEIKVIEIPTDTKVIAVGTTMLNLGYVIHANQLFALEEAVRKASISPQLLTGRNALCSCGSNKRYKDCCGRLK